MTSGAAPSSSAADLLSVAATALSEPAQSAAPASALRQLRAVGKLAMMRVLIEQTQEKVDKWAELERRNNVASIKRAIESKDEKLHHELEKGRILRRFNLPITLKVVLHDTAYAPGREGEHCFMAEVPDKVSLAELQQLVKQRFSRKLRKGRKLRLMWLTGDGHSVLIDSQRALHQWIDDKWCTHPVILHVLDETTATSDALDLADRASLVFEQHDVNGDGTIDRGELSSLLHGMLSANGPQLSPHAVEHFVEAEFARADTDGSAGLDFDEFCRFYNKLSDWSRLQLVATNQHVHVYKIISEHYLEATMAPQPLLRSEMSSYQGRGGQQRARKFGVRLDVPPEALPGTHVDAADDPQHGPQARFALGTLLPHRVTQLAQPDADGGAPQPDQMLLSPIVQLDVTWPAGSEQARAHAAAVEAAQEAADDGDDEAAEAAFEARPRFEQKALLTLPHCLAVRDSPDAEPSRDAPGRVQLLSCPEGRETWEVVPQKHVRVGEFEVAVLVRQPGRFVAYSQPSTEAAMLVRLYVMLAPRLPPYRASSLRVHACPLLASQLEEVELEEHCEFGLVAVAGHSRTLQLVPGQVLHVSVQGHTEKLIWLGSRCHCCLLYDPRLAADARAAGATGATTTTKEVGTDYVDTLHVASSMGVVGKRSQFAEAAAKNSGISTAGYELEFHVALHRYSPPEAPRAPRLLERLPKQFTLRWQPPLATGGCAVRRYAIEVASTFKGGEAAERRPPAWREVWEGAELRAVVPQYVHTGVVRLRCWNVGCPHPSPYSEEIEILEYDGVVHSNKGGGEGGAEAATSPLKAPLTSSPSAKGGDAARWGSGGRPGTAQQQRPATAQRGARPSSAALTRGASTSLPASANGGAAASQPKPKVPTTSADGKLTRTSTLGRDSTAEAQASRRQSTSDAAAPAERRIPASVGKLGPRAVAAAHTIADFYDEAGAETNGRLYGMLLSHVVIAVAEGRAGAGLGAPLSGLASVALHDAIVPLAQQAAVCRDEWEVVIDRCEGFIALSQSFSDAEAVKDILFVLVELYETARQSGTGGYLMRHIGEPTYGRPTRAALEEELQGRLTDLYWKISTDVLKILIKHKADVSEPAEPASRRPKASPALERKRSSMEDSMRG